MSNGHSLNPGWKSGDHWCECERCGLDYRSSKMRKEWNGSKVCTNCFETRHPQDFVRGRVEDSSAKGIVTSEISRGDNLILDGAGLRFLLNTNSMYFGMIF